MMTIILIFATIACTLCLGGIFILYRYAEPSRSHRSLMAMIAMWLFMVIYGAIKIAVEGEDLSGGITVLDIKLLMRSYFSIFPFIFYIISIFDDRVLRLRNMAVVLVPAAAVTALYFGWYLVSGEPYDVIYHSYGELWASRGSAMVILRVLMMAVILFYIFGAVSFVWSLSYRLRSCCVDSEVVSFAGVRTNALSLLTISLAFMFNLLYHSDLSIVIYIIAGVFAFSLIVDNAMFHKQVELPSNFGVEWRFPKQWIVVESDVTNDDNGVEVISTFVLFNQWLNSSKPYCHHSFSIKDVEDNFSAEQCGEIAQSIRSAGYNFQSYIRAIRIKEAVRIMESRDDVNTTQLAEMVGFSHISSFSRAFNAVMHKSPSEYKVN